MNLTNYRHGQYQNNTKTKNKCIRRNQIKQLRLKNKNLATGRAGYEPGIYSL